MVFKYLVIGFVGTVSMAMATPSTVSFPAPAIAAPTPEPAKTELPVLVPAPAPAPAPAPVTVSAPAKEIAPDPKAIQHAILNALEKQGNSIQVDELITIKLQDLTYEVSVKLNPRNSKEGSLTLNEFFTVISEDHLRNAKEKGVYTSFAYKNGNKIGLTDLTAGSIGNNYRVSRLSLKFKKSSF